MARDVVEPQMTQLATAKNMTMGEEQTNVAPAPTPPARRIGAFAPLRRRNFSLLFSGQVISMLGDQAYSLALPWTVLVVTGDPRQVGVVLAAGAAPRVVLLLLGGALADRLSPRLVMIVADLMRVVVVGALGFTLIHGLPALWVVALLAGLEGAGTGLFQPGSQAMLPATVPADELPAGNGLMMIIQFLTLIIGPIAGGVATAAQASVAFFADAASFGVSALSLLGILLPWRAAKPGANASADALATPLAAATLDEGEALAADAPAIGGASAAQTKRAGIFGEIGAGFTYAFSNPLLRTAMAMTILGNFAFAGVANVALIVLAHALSPNPLTLGYILAAIGVGGVIGGLSASLLGRAKRRGLILGGMWVVISALMAAATLVAGPAGRLQLGPLGIVQFNAVPLDWRAPAVAIVMGLLALLLALTDTTFLTIMQQTIAPEYLARVFSIQFTAGGITQPLSLLLAGVLAATVGPGVVFVGGGAALLLAVVVGMSSRALRTV